MLYAVKRLPYLVTISFFIGNKLKKFYNVNYQKKKKTFYEYFIKNNEILDNFLLNSHQIYKNSLIKL